MRYFSALLIVITALLVAACDKNTTNYYSNPLNTTSIEGLIAPADSGIAIATARQTYQTTISPSGYYLFEDVEAGIYTITVVPYNHNRRVLKNISVAPHERNTMPTLALLDFPFPILGSVPANFDPDVSLNASFSILCDDFLDFESFKAGISIEPPLVGKWSQGVIDYPYLNIQQDISYSLSRISPLDPWLEYGKTYTITIDSTVRMASGEKLGTNCVFAFTVIPIEYNATISATGISGRVPLWQFNPVVSFSDCILVDSFKSMVEFHPEIEGAWIADQSSCYG